MIRDFAFSYVYPGSYAETWAKNNGYTFEVITNET